MNPNAQPTRLIEARQRNFSNRRIRTRTYGGGGGAEPRGFPLSRSRRIMWRLTICGARGAIVSVEHGSGLLTPHIFVWMIALHHCDGGSSMHDELFKEPTVIARYRTGPYTES